MAMWPFRRKGSRRRSRTVPIDNSNIEIPGDGHRYQLTPRTKTEPDSIIRDSAGTGGANKIPQRRSRAYSYSPGRQDSLRVAKLRKRSSVQARESLPTVDASQRMPTLYHDNSRNKRRGQPLFHKKSSKRLKEDHDREAEIRAMSQFMPTRPATDHWTAGRPIKRESRQFRSSVTGGVDQPSSDISLPVPESIHSAMSSDSEQISWKVSAFDALSPRPTLRYSSNPFTSSSPGSGLIRSQSTRKKIGPMTIPESTLHDHRRIHDLADDFDASDLRELMERDKRRRERKAEKERERAQRRLARRSEKQRAEEAAAAKTGTPPPENLERGVLGREMHGSSGDRTSAVITSSRRRSSGDSRRPSRQSSEIENLENRGKTPSPLDEFYRTDSIPPPEPASPIQVAESAVSSKKAESIPAPSNPRLFGFIRSKKSRSTSPEQSGQLIPTTVHSPPTASIKLDDAESVSRTSDSRSSRPWLSLFKWGKNRRGSGPSSFSNTSRDSMLGSQPTAPTNHIPPRKASSGVPKRTMSRFREDLPELPISPPDSRVASPEAEPFLAEPLPVIPDDDVAMRYDTPIESHKYQEAMRATPISIHRDEVQPSPALHSMSLASVDSEASWLSGRISRKRTSSGMRTSLQYPPRTVSALSGRSEGQASEHTEDDNIVDDEYLNSVVPTGLHRHSTGEARPSSDEDDSSPKWGAVGQTPTVIQHSETMRSREGVLQSFDDNKEFSNANESEDDGDGQSPVEPQRATSVKLNKGHLRNFSAGSAKLFEIPPRSSGDHKISNQ
ncbi:hypothetical protein F5X98DRAFT_275139 [Xylaria grammica]|nr:hypothetical protein F5X98DRAFT_275139 [Xylaria grammica]